MDNDKGKISQYQSILLYIIMFSSPCIRYLPSFTVKEARQAAWVSIFFAIIIGYIYLLTWNAIMKHYRNISYVDILKDILGKKIGTIFGLIFFVWLTIMTAYNIRVFLERILGSATPNVTMVLLLTVFLLAALYVLKSGLVVIARMNEIFFIFIMLIFISATILIIPKIDINNYFPISYKDIFPAFKASAGMYTMWSYVSILFIYYDKVTVRENYKKLNFKLFVFMIIFSLIIILIPLGVFGSDVLTKMPIPFLSSVMEISFFNTIERIDAAIIIFWLITDFVLMVTFIYSAIHMVKVNFKLESIRPLYTIYAFLVFFLSAILIKSTFEMNSLSQYILTPVNISIGFFLPMLVFVVGKIRKKL